ncbi:APC family permease [Parathermosynechococcus lividus]
MLKRELGLTGAILTGLGSMIGTGIFVSLGIAAGIAGSWVLVALALAAGLALCNGLSSAQLAASHPLSGGTYEYGYRYLSPALGFTAGWMFLVAKSASAATAALGCMGYLLSVLPAVNLDDSAPVVGAIALIWLLTGVVILGVRRSSHVNLAILTVTFLSLLTFVIVAAQYAQRQAWVGLTLGWDPLRLPDVLQATALMFVAYSGYARITVLGEEVKAPQQTIPRAIGLTIGFVMLLYGAVAVVALAGVGSTALGQAAHQQAAPLEVLVTSFGVPWVRPFIAVGAIAAMVGILLNLILGLSRMVLAMARRGDLPAVLAQISLEGSRPTAAILTVSLGICLLVLLGNVKTTWSFSAFSVLIYYAITNWAALQLPEGDRQFPRWLAIVGLVGCGGLTVWVEPVVWCSGSGLIVIGLAWHYCRRKGNAA